MLRLSYLSSKVFVDLTINEKIIYSKKRKY